MGHGRRDLVVCASGRDGARRQLRAVISMNRVMQYARVSRRVLEHALQQGARRLLVAQAVVALGGGGQMRECIQGGRVQIVGVSLVHRFLARLPARQAAFIVERCPIAIEGTGRLDVGSLAFAQARDRSGLLQGSLANRVIRIRRPAHPKGVET